MLVEFLKDHKHSFFQFIKGQKKQLAPDLAVELIEKNIAREVSRKITVKNGLPEDFPQIEAERKAAETAAMSPSEHAETAAITPTKSKRKPKVKTEK